MNISRKIFDWGPENYDRLGGKFFDPKDIAVDVKHMAVENILRRIIENDIDLMLGFQRQFDLWPDESKSQLIESVLLNFPVPPLYFDASNGDKWLVVDGLQRLWTLKTFVLENKFQLRGLSAMPHLNGFTFEQLEKQYQRKIREYDLIVYLIRPGTPRLAIYDIFRRLNTGGISLNAQEIRQALNPKAGEFLEGLTKNGSFKALVKPKRKRLEHFELALRFCSFYILNYKRYQPPLSIFLDHTMESINSVDGDTLHNIFHDFEKALTFIDKYLGQDIYYKTNAATSKRSFNKGLFEAWTVTLALVDSLLLEKLKESKDQILSDFEELLMDPTFVDAISYNSSNKKSVENRFLAIENLVKKHIYDNQH